MHKKLSFALIVISSFCFSQVEKGRDYVQMAFEISETNPDSGIYYAEQAIEIGLMFNDSLTLGSGYLELGSAYRIKGEPYKSMEALHLALRFLPRTEEGKSEIAAAYSSLGNLYYFTSQLEKAKKNYWRSFQIKREIGKEFESALVATQLASIYAIDSTSDSAFFFAHYALPYLNEKEHPNYIANLYNALGAKYSFNQDFLDSSLFYYQRAEGLFGQIGFKTQIAAAQYNIANIYAKQGKHKEAEQVYLKALENLSPEGDQLYRLTILTELSSIYLKTHNYIKYVEIDHLKDSVNNLFYSTENRKNLMELEEKYESAQKDQEIRENKIKIQKSELELAAERERFYNWLIILVSALGLICIVFIYVYLKRRNEKQLEKEKERFFSNIVHEIRTPLTLISAPVAQLKLASTDSASRTKFSLIERNIQRLGTLVNQLLDLSKIDSKKYKLNYTYGNLELFLFDVAERAEQLAFNKEIEIEMKTIGCDQIVKLDYDAIEKIIMNLISNAIKYSEPRTKVNLIAVLDHDELQFQVKDQGYGIPDKLQQKVFTRFDRGENQEPNKGVGIGLSLVKELCQLLGASINLESKVNEGSEFTIKIPVEQTLKTDNELNLKQIENLVLLVEDDTDMRSFIQHLLVERGFQVIAKENGVEALKTLEQQLPALILSDAMMPEMDGYTLVNKVKSTDLYSHIPVIFLSAKASHESKLKGLKSGADFYLEKPFNPEELLLTIRNTIETIGKNQVKFAEKLTNEELSFEEKIVSDDPFINKLNQIILKEIDNSELTVEALADQLAISRSQLHRKIKSVSGKSISHYIRILRLEKSLELLKQKEGNVSEVAFSTGFNSQSYFTKCFTDHFGFSPSQLDKNQ